LKSSAKNVTLTSVDDLFTTEEEREEKKREKVRNIPLAELHPFRDHPFKVVDDDKMQETVDSIREYGVLVPIIARPKEDGGYEIVSGHRRCHASELAGLETVPVIVRDLDDDEATVIMVDSNLQRENLLPSERAKAYKMKMEAMKRRAGRPSKENCGQNGHNLSGQKTRDLLADDVGESARTIQRYIRLTDLIPDLLDMVDDKKLNFNSTVEISYLPHEEQQLVHETIVSETHAPTFAQAQEIKKLSQKKELTDDTVLSVFGNKEDSRAKVAELPEQKTEVMPQTSPKTLNIPMERFAKYFPNRSEAEITEMIFKVLDTWHHHMQKRRNGQSR